MSCPPSIQCWDLNPRTSEHESPPITTRPGLPPNMSQLFSKALLFRKRDGLPLSPVHFIVANNIRLYLAL